MSNSFWPHGLYSPYSPGQNTGVGNLSLLQVIFPTQGSNPGLLHCRQILYQLSYQGSPMTNLDNIFKSRDSTLPTNLHLVKAMVFPVVMYGCKSWTVRKAERKRMDVFKLWCWRRLLRVPWTARRSNQSILKEISPGCSLEGLMLKLKLQYFGHLMQRTDSMEKTLMLGKIEGRRSWMASQTQWTWVWASSGSWWWTGKPGVLQSMGPQRVGRDWVTGLNWFRGKKFQYYKYLSSFVAEASTML